MVELLEIMIAVEIGVRELLEAGRDLVGEIVEVELNGFLSNGPGQEAGHCKKQLAVKLEGTLVKASSLAHVQPPLSQ